MTGKELLLVVAGTTVFAGAGGVAASLALRADRAPETDTAVLDRLAKIDRALEDTNTTLQESRDDLGRLRSRLDYLEQNPAASRRGRPGRVDPSAVGAASGGVDDGEEALDGRASEWTEAAGEELRAGIEAGVQDAMQALKRQIVTRSGTFGTVVGGARVMGADGQPISFTAAGLGNIAKSWELRALPEEKRWEKARTDVGLNDVQVEEIKAAVAERDKAVRDAMVVEKDEQTDSGAISVRRMDPAKTAAANQAYRDRVDRVLNDQQKKAWSDNGYDGAFGSGPVGATTGMVISIGTTFSEGTDKPK